MNNDLSKLVEAVRAAHADIAPTYAEYVQLAFAIATDCGEAGRSDFISLCEPSPKFNARQQAFLQCLAHRKPECPSGHRFPLGQAGGRGNRFQVSRFHETLFLTHTCEYI